ncbi:hypothetical protein IFR05_008049 [Cadophora sp. M221]|nr:hypothetical protein IFR05_008049 [Cadophora sp. M221]
MADHRLSIRRSLSRYRERCSAVRAKLRVLFQRTERDLSPSPPQFIWFHDSAAITASDQPWIPPTMVNPPRALRADAFLVPSPQQHSDGRYAYAALEPLGSGGIRLLRIPPASDKQEPIQCEILHTTITAAADRYEALSYVWGDASSREEITVGSSGATLSVTTNCACAIRNLRYPDRETLVWIDALCINQEDIAERNSQVALMNKIYSHTSRVTVFLGDATEDSDMIMDHLACFQIDHGSFGDEISGELRRAMVNLLSRPWFARVWILQEIFKARADGAFLVCGDRWVDWSQFRYFEIVQSRRLRESVFQSTSSFRLYPSLPWPFVTELSGYSQLSCRKKLVWVLMKTRNFGATDPRDKVFALFNLFHDSASEGLQADYNLTTVQVFVNTAKYLAMHDLGFLSAVQSTWLTPPPTKRLPSWVPDWSQAEIRKPMWLNSKAFGVDSFQAAPRVASSAQVLDDPNGSPPRIVLQGVILGTVPPLDEWTCHLPQDDWNFEQRTIQDTLQAWREALLSIRRKYPSLYSTNKIFPIFRTLHLNWNTKSDERREVQEILTERTTLATDNGHYGLAPMSIEGGDVVCVALGYGLPFILRRTVNGEFTFVGECYVHGVMEGELGIEEGGSWSAESCEVPTLSKELESFTIV